MNKDPHNTQEGEHCSVSQNALCTVYGSHKHLPTLSTFLVQTINQYDPVLSWAPRILRVPGFKEVWRIPVTTARSCIFT